MKMNDIKSGSFKCKLLVGDAKDVLKDIPDNTFHMAVTSPPYWDQRNYRVEGQLGQEDTPEEYIENLVDICREVRRTLRSEGTFWINIGDGYCKKPLKDSNLKQKDLVGIPWACAKALRDPYYTGNIRKEVDRVWLASMIDGEGSINGFTHVRKDTGKTRRGISINVTNSNIDLLDNCFRIWPTSKRDHNKHGKGHLGKLDTYRWYAHKIKNKLLLLAEIYPYLIAKKKQALLAWNFLQISKDARGREHDKENDNKCKWIVENLSKLNHQKDVIIPNWIKEPPSLEEPGWYLRSDIIWKKTNPMPESQRNRPSKSHEHLFLFAKSEKYFHDAEAIAEEQKPISVKRAFSKNSLDKRKDAKSDEYAISGKSQDKTYQKMQKMLNTMGDGFVPLCNKKDVWSLATADNKIKHFAQYPDELPRLCILAGSSSKGCCPKCQAPWSREWMKEWEPSCDCGESKVKECIVLDPFNGSGTTGRVCRAYNRKYVGIDISEEYLSYAREDLIGDKSECESEIIDTMEEFLLS